MRLDKHGGLEATLHLEEGVQLDGLRETLDRHPVAAGLFMPGCHNPTGAAISEARKQEGVTLLGERGVPLIEG